MGDNFTQLEFWCDCKVDKRESEIGTSFVDISVTILRVKVQGLEDI